MAAEKKKKKKHKLNPRKCVRWILGPVCLYVGWLVLLPWLPAIVAWAYFGLENVPLHLWPSNVFDLVLHYGPQTRITTGSTRFANSSLYPPYTVTEEQRAHYFEHGWVLLPGALPPDVLTELRTILFKVGVPLWPWSINTHFMIDEVLDFYMFSNLGDIMSQFMGNQSVHLFSDFRYWRETGQQHTEFHYDGGECESPLLHANFTARTRMRAWISLDDNQPTPPILDQDYFKREDVLSSKRRETFWKSCLVPENISLFRSEYVRHIEQASDIWDNVPMEERQAIMVRNRVRLGDVLVHSPCSGHESPVNDPDTKLMGFLCPTFQPESSRLFKCAGCSPDLAKRNCKHNLQVGDTMKDEPCFPQVFPRPDHMRGKVQDLEYDGNRYHWYLGFVNRRLRDLWRWPGLGEYMMADNFPERPTAHKIARLAAWLGYYVVPEMPGFYWG